jgi:hypothetical protein
MAESSFIKMVESQSYKNQVASVNRAINSSVRPSKIGDTWYAPARMADLGRVLSVDYPAFKKTSKERGELITLKKKYLKEMKAKFPGFEKRKSTKKEYLTLNVKNIW